MPAEPKVLRTEEPNIEQLAKRIKMLDERLDNIDSTVTALIEQVMRRPVTIEVACPNCGEIVQTTIVGNTRLRGRK